MARLYKPLILGIFLFLSLVSYSQKRKVDSLTTLVENLAKKSGDYTSDTIRVNSMNMLASELRHNNMDKAMEYAREALAISQKQKYAYGIATSYARIGIMHKIKSNYADALTTLDTALTLYLKIGDKLGIASTHVNIGLIYKEKGEYTKTLEAYFKSLKIVETLNDPDAEAKVLGNIGVTYKDQGKLTLAKEYYMKALALDEKTGNKVGIASRYNNLGLVASDERDYMKALEYFKNSIRLSEEMDDKSSAGRAYGNIGLVYLNLKHYDKALEHYEKALGIKIELGDKTGTSLWLNNIGTLYLEQRNYRKAVEYFNQSQTIAKKLGYKPSMLENYKKLSMAYTAMKDFEKALQQQLEYASVKDSIFNVESSKQIAEMQTKYDTDKKQQEIELLNKDKVIQEAEFNRQKTVKNLLIGGILLLVLFAFVLVNRFRLIRKQKKIIELQKIMVEVKNKDITDSIQYAKRIQQTLLPQEKFIDRTLKRLNKN